MSHGSWALFTITIMMSKLVLLVVVATALTVVQASDLVTYDISTQSKCTEVTRSATRNCIWAAGLNSFADQLAEKGRISAYKIQWFNKSWSQWFVPGVNDLDWKFNTAARKCSLPYNANTMRRAWSYFYDHTHRFIICKQQ